MSRDAIPAISMAALALFLMPAALSAAETQPDPAAVEFFEKKIRPVLVEHCHTCHSTGKKRRGGLLLDSRASMLKGGDTGPAVVPGDPAGSLLVKAISYTDEPRMPPRSKLPQQAIADLTAWVKMGAPWPGGDKPVGGSEKFDFEARRKHWSFQPVSAAIPSVVQGASWPRTPIDRFILARLEAKGLKPAAPADRRALLRRLTYDLTGLPPTPGEIEAFVNDTSPAAYEKVVDRLLSSPAYGERWGRHWLDIVRFAETSGHEFDFDIPQAYKYRDAVVRAFNDDVPYDEFVREHVAGDLLPRPRRHPTERTNESVLMTGFWFLGESKHSPVDLRVDGGDRRDNMIDVFGKAFLGLTISCARCHDHKFDPIYTKDYYSLVSYIQSSRQQLAFLDEPGRIATRAGKARQLRQEAGRVAVKLTTQQLAFRLAGLEQALLDARKADSVLAKALARDELFRAWRILADPALKTPDAWQAKRKDLLAQLKSATKQAEEPGKDRKVFEDFSRGGYRDWFVSGDAFGKAPSGIDDVEIQPSKPLPVVRLARGANSGLTSRRLEGALRSKTFPIDKKFILYRVRGQNVRVNLIIDGFQMIQEPIYGGLRFTINTPEPRWHAQNVGMWLGQKAYIEVLDDGDGWCEVQEVQFSDHPSPPPVAPNPLLTALVVEAKSLDELAKGYQKLLRETAAAWGDGKLTGRDRVALVEALLASPVIEALPSPVSVKAEGRDHFTRLTAQADRLEASIPKPNRGLAISDGTGHNDRVHIRGNPKTLGEEAPRRLPVVLGGEKMPAPANSGRLDMADRLTAADNPLFARVMVNRLWHHHFGHGLVRSVDDFGHQGEKPTHPELLDWLAGEFVRSGWSVKHMHRLMLLSATYQQASRADDESDRADPKNDLLHRMPIRRLEAESIRDAMLAVSGRLDRTMFGQGPLPYLTEFMVGRGRPSVSGPLDGDGRRSLYLSVRRNFLNPMFLAFDYPIPATTIGRRSVSNVPAQALTLLNNPFVLQQAKLWAERVLAIEGSDEVRIQAMYECAYGRKATSEELTEAKAFLAEQGKEYGRVDARAWGDLAHVLFNVKEFIFVN